MTLALLRDRLNGLVGVQMDADEVAKLLGEVISEGGGVTIENDEARYRLVRREGKYEIKKSDPRRSSFPPYR